MDANGDLVGILHFHKEARHERLHAGSGGQSQGG
jgi:hypothetical protein